MAALRKESFDYIIVGGGVSGLVLAARLTENADVSVCVLEAGPELTHKAEIQIPGLAFKNTGRPDLHWMFNSVPQPGLNDRVISQPRGKALGGSGTINYLTVGRGHAQEYDAFESLGSSGWNWSSILEGLKKSETYTVTPEEAKKFGVKVDPRYHGTSGPFQRTLPKWVSNLYEPWVKAMQEQGVPLNLDPASGDNSGVWASNLAVHPTEAVRSSAATGYYEPAKNRPNLLVLTGVQATQIIFRSEEDGLVAEGVKFLKDATRALIRADKEVILSAGAYGTPQLLELSGIGDKGILAKHGIETLVDLPGVGSNLQEHMSCWYTAEIDDSWDTLEVLLDEKRAAKELEEYHRSKTGMMTYIASCAFAFVPSKAFMQADAFEKAKGLADQLKGDETLEIQKGWLSNEAIPHLELAIVPGFMPTTGKHPELGKSYMSMLVALVHPFSRGSIHISSSDPCAAPLIDPSIFDNEVDPLMMVEGYKFCRRLVASPAFKGIVKAEVNPAPQRQSDDDLRDLAKDITKTVFHPVGTAAMRPRDQKGVVDSNLKVYGTKNLRVVDASVIPIQISAHPQATVYAVAERAADLIKNGH